MVTNPTTKPHPLAEWFKEWPPERLGTAEQVEEFLADAQFHYAQVAEARRRNSCPTVTILGHAQAGKDTFAQKLSERFDGLLHYSGYGTSSVLLDAVRSVSEEAYALVSELRTEPIVRAYLADLGDEIRAQDMTRIVRCALGRSDIAVGIRRRMEFAAAWAQGLLNYVVWVHRPGNPPDRTLTIRESDIVLLAKRHPERVFWVDNCGDESGLDSCVASVVDQMIDSMFQGE